MHNFASSEIKTLNFYSLVMKKLFEFVAPKKTCLFLLSKMPNRKQKKKVRDSLQYAL